MADEREADRRARRDDEKVQEEIRRLFARYRRIARHGMVTERDEPAEERDTAPLARR